MNTFKPSKRMVVVNGRRDEKKNENERGKGKKNEKS